MATYNIVRRPNQDKRETHYDHRESKPILPHGKASITSRGAQARGRQIRQDITERVDLIGRLEEAFYAAQCRGDEAGMERVIAEMDAAGMGALAAQYRREIR